MEVTLCLVEYPINAKRTTKKIDTVGKVTMITVVHLPDGSGVKQFSIKIVADNKMKCEVIKSVDEIKKFYDEFNAKNPAFFVPPVEDTAQSVESLINKAIDFVGVDIDYFILKFLECDKDTLIKFRMKFLYDEVQKLKICVVRDNSLEHALHKKCDDLILFLEDYEVGKGGSPVDVASLAKVRSGSDASGSGFYGSKLKVIDEWMLKLGLSTPTLVAPVSAIPPPPGFEKMASINEEKQQLIKPSPLVDERKQFTSKSPRSEVKSPALRRLEECGRHSGFSIEHIWKILQPYDSQYVYRDSVIGSFKKYIRMGADVNAFDVSFYAVECFLPDDPVKLTVVANKPAAVYQPIVDKLNQVAENQGAAADPMEVQRLGNLRDSFATHFTHSISNVTGALKEGGFHIRCSVDALEAEISVNARVDLTLLAFLEDINSLVGKGSLFKQSILLIRAWWLYETSLYVGNSVRHLLSEHCLFVMICAVFNQYHASIHNPFQALLMFLAEYADYDGLKEVVTIQGIVSFDSSSENAQPCFVEPLEGQLVTPAMLQKYTLKAPEFEVAPAGTKIKNPLNSSSSHDDDFEDIFSSFVNAKSRSMFDFVETASAPADTTAAPSAAEDIKPFARHYGFNIANPFDRSNLVTNETSSTDCMVLHKIFRIGSYNFFALIKTTAEMPVPPLSSKDILQSFYPNIFNRFGTHWRPDAVNGTIAPHPKLLDVKPPVDYTQMYVGTNLERLWKKVLFARLVAEGSVTDAALLSLILEVLASKGPTPITQLQKVLVDITGSAALANVLKERYGGLRLFLDRHENLVFIANDPPFNPSVALRSTMPPDQTAKLAKEQAAEIVARMNSKHEMLQKTGFGAPHSQNPMFQPQGPPMQPPQFGMPARHHPHHQQQHFQPPPQPQPPVFPVNANNVPHLRAGAQVGKPTYNQRQMEIYAKLLGPGAAAEATIAKSSFPVGGVSNGRNASTLNTLPSQIRSNGGAEVTRQKLDFVQGQSISMKTPNSRGFENGDAFSGGSSPIPLAPGLSPYGGRGPPTPPFGQQPPPPPPHNSSAFSTPISQSSGSFQGAGPIFNASGGGRPVFAPSGSNNPFSGGGGLNTPPPPLPMDGLGSRRPNGLPLNYNNFNFKGKAFPPPGAQFNPPYPY